MLLRMQAAAGVLFMFVAAGVLVSCADDGPRSAAPATSTTLMPPATVPAATAPAATALAPSQIAGSTVPAPASPPPCDVDQVELAAPPGIAGPSPADTVIRIRNISAVQCEVDVSDSPNADPLMEPSVWLDPGAEAELLATDIGATCARPAPVAFVDVTVNGVATSVPVTIASTCGVRLTAIYPVESE
jgi:hypothetical protein